MIKENIINYLETNLKSTPNQIMDNNDRLVWISDVIDVVSKMLEGKMVKEDTEKVMGDCYDKVGYYDVTQEVFQWLNDNDYIICKKVTEEQPQPMVYPEVGEDEFLEYKDGFGNWYKLTDDLKNNKHFFAFKIRVSKK